MQVKEIPSEVLLPSFIIYSLKLMLATCCFACFAIWQLLILRWLGFMCDTHENSGVCVWFEECLSSLPPVCSKNFQLLGGLFLLLFSFLLLSRLYPSYLHFIRTTSSGFTSSCWDLWPKHYFRVAVMLERSKWKFHFLMTFECDLLIIESKLCSCYYGQFFLASVTWTVFQGYSNAWEVKVKVAFS